MSEIDVDDLLDQHNVDRTSIPNHIAIIMDGNGRWAKQRNLPRNFGHKEGQKNVKRTLINCVKIGVKVLTIYVFSTENWRRPDHEVSFLLMFFKKSIRDELNELIEQGVRLRFLGDLTVFDNKMRDLIHDAERQTQHNSRIQLNVMLNYGGRREIIDAVQSYHGNGGRIDDLSEETFSTYLYSDVNDPEILIRTGGDYRISNFLLWQLAYSELFFLELFWPDFDMLNLVQVISEFQNRERRYGGLVECSE